MLNVQLTKEQFLTVFGDNELVKGFSIEAKNVMISFIMDTGADWKESFQQAAELPESEVSEDEKEHSIPLKNGNWLVL